jgi:hypothetical protein
MKFYPEMKTKTNILTYAVKSDDGGKLKNQYPSLCRKKR